MVKTLLWGDDREPEGAVVLTISRKLIPKTLLPLSLPPIPGFAD
jgi:hypothetical protein